MKVISQILLAKHMARNDMSGARLGRTVKRSRQFISQLLNEPGASCTREVAEGIERALSVAPGTLFAREPGERGRTRSKRGTDTLISREHREVA